MNPGVTNDPSASSTRSPREVAAELGDLAVDHSHVDGLRGPAGAVDHLPTLDHVLAGHASPWVVAARLGAGARACHTGTRPMPVCRSPSSARPRGPRETRRSRSGHRRATPRRGPAHGARRRPRRRSRGPSRIPARRGSGFRRCDGSDRTGRRRRRIERRAGVRDADRRDRAGLAVSIDDPPAVDVVPRRVLDQVADEAVEERPVPDHRRPARA